MGQEGAEAPSDLNERRPVVCNTSDEAIFANIRHALTLGKTWLQLAPAHDGIAVLVGGGPSLKTTLEEIRARHKAGQHVFALNGTLEWLAQKEIVAHSHVLLDARESNARFVRKPPRKTHYLVSSQCHPAIFEALKKREVTVWQPNYPGVTDLMGHIECALIGGGTTVGMQAMSIAWALGYRTIHLYGFDSSYENKKGHAYKQPENDGEEIHECEVRGRVFYASNWMIRQAEEFQEASVQLADGDAVIHVHGDGLLPWVAKCMENPITLAEAEEQKYHAVWKHDDYRVYSPGKIFANEIVHRIPHGDSLIDYGCGTGRATQIFRRAGIDAVGIDFVPTALETDVPFVKACLWELPEISSDWAFCADVMEHIPPEKVDEVLSGISERTKKGAFFQIYLEPDSMGLLVGQTLHLTVQPASWWYERLSRFWDVTSDERGHAAVFTCKEKS